MATTTSNEDAKTTLSNDNYGGEAQSKHISENLDPDVKAPCTKGPNMANNLHDIHTSRTASPCGLGNTYMKEVIASLHRATMASAMSSIAIRDAALVSLVHIVESETTENICDNSSHANSPSCQYSLIVLQAGSKLSKFLFTLCDISYISILEICLTAIITFTYLQTWLDQFARTNGGSSPSEYAGVDRVRLLHTLKVSNCV